MHRTLALVATFAATLATTLLTSVAAPAGAAPTDAGVRLGVALPADAIPAQPGAHVQLGFAVTNGSDDPLAVRVTQRQLALGDNGAVTLQAAPDPVWAPGMTVPEAPVTVPAHGSARVTVPTVVPDLPPDVYLVGFQVTSLPTADARVQILSSVGAYVPVDIPGPRDRRLTAHIAAPGFVWGGAAHTQLDIVNAGRSSLYFWGEDGRMRMDRTFLPSGHRRTVALDLRHPVGLAHAHPRVFYNGADNQVVQVDVTSRRMLFLPPKQAVAAGGALVAVAVAECVRRRRKRRVGSRVAARAAAPRFSI
jgi:hypothetical protein